MSTPLSRQMDQMADAQEWKERAEAAEAKLAEAQEDLRLRDIDCGCNSRVTRLEAEVERLEGLILELKEELGPEFDAALYRRRIRAQREEGK